MGVVTRMSGKEQIPRFSYGYGQGGTYRKAHTGEDEGAGTHQRVAGPPVALFAEPYL